MYYKIIEHSDAFRRQIKRNIIADLQFHIVDRLIKKIHQSKINFYKIIFNQ